ncbi:MAG: silent information regulator protein Sir2 [Phycisphaerae bacterium]|nr:silent information regulator protein Sir2 [Phycisphaerae bacterium]
MRCLPLAVLLSVFVWYLTPSTVTADERKTLIFEVEDYTTPKDAWETNKFSETKWNLWSTDKEADKKWSGGVVLQSPRVLKDRDKPEDGAPPLHTHITGIPKGRWDVSLGNVGRVLAVSMDGKQWRPVSGRDAYLGAFDIVGGTFDVWVDDRYASPANAGSSYYDYLIFEPLRPRVVRPKVAGWAKQRVIERIDRGLVALPVEGGVYVGWRLLASDPKDTTFNVYRCAGGSQPVKLNEEPIGKTTDFVDRSAPRDAALTYTVRPIADGKEAGPSSPGTVARDAKPAGYVSIKLKGDHTFQKVGIADLNGDGKYDFVLKQPNTNIDPWIKYYHPSKGTYKIEAYLGDGTFLWQNDLGWSIEQGIWYSPYLVWDFDGDGKAEVAVKTGQGDPRDPDGLVTSGPEYLSIRDGMTGKETARVDWPSREGYRGDRAHAYNYYCRNQLGVAYLDGKTPCLIVERGTYGLIKVVAYQYRGGKLSELWRWDNRQEGRNFRGQGAHFLHCVDIDADGRDEVLIGSAVIDDDGASLWTTGLGHPDHFYVGDIDPSRPGLEIYYGMESRQPKNGMCLVDARTGKLVWGLGDRTFHIHASGMCADIDPNHPGMECYGGEAAKAPEGKNRRWLFTAQGELLAREKTFDHGCSIRTVYWDADPYREMLLGNKIQKHGGKTLTESIAGGHAAWADILGDWREEVITSVAGELRIYTTTIPATDRRVCLMQDPIHRIDVAHLSMGYPQPPMTTFCPSATVSASR